MRYGDVAEIPGIGRERFSMFAFADHLERADTEINVMHDRTLTIGSRRGGELALTDSPEALRMVATLPAGDAYDSVLALVGDGLAEGLSVEFVAQQERRTGDTRTIMRATLPALGVVDVPAYGQSGVEVRARGQGLSGEFTYNRDRVVRDRGQRRKVRVSPGAFKYQLDRFEEAQIELAETIQAAIKKGHGRGVRAIVRVRFNYCAGRSYDAPLASLCEPERCVSSTLTTRSGSRLTGCRRLQLRDDLRASMASGSADFGVDLMYSDTARIGRG